MVPLHILTNFNDKYHYFQLKMLLRKRVSVFLEGYAHPCLGTSNNARFCLTVSLGISRCQSTLLPILEVIRSHFQLKMLESNRVSVFTEARTHPTYGYVSVVLTRFRGKYIDFQLKMLYGEAGKRFLQEGCTPPT